MLHRIFFNLLMYVFLFSLWLFYRYGDVNFKIGQGIWWFWEFILVFSDVLFSATVTNSLRLLPTMLFCLLISVTVVNFVVLHHLLSKQQHSHAAWWPCAVIYPRLVLLIYHFWCPVVQTLVSMIRHGWIVLSVFDFSHDCPLNFLLSTFFSYVFPQLLENHIKKELTENSQLVQAIPSHEQNKLPSYEPRRSASVACGSSVFEVCMRVPTWASQVNCFFFLKVYVSWSRFQKFNLMFVKNWFWPIKWFWEPHIVAESILQYI